MSQDHPHPESGNGRTPDADARDADLTAFALNELSPDEFQALQQRLQADPAAQRSVDQIRSLARLLRESSALQQTFHSESLRTAIEHELERLDEPAGRVTLNGSRHDRGWSRVRRLFVTGIVSATVLIAAAIYMSGQFRQARVAATDAHLEERAGSELRAARDKALKTEVDELYKEAVASAKREAEKRYQQIVRANEENRSREAKRLANEAQQVDSHSEYVEAAYTQPNDLRFLRESLQNSREAILDKASTFKTASSLPNQTPPTGQYSYGEAEVVVQGANLPTSANLSGGYVEVHAGPPADGRELAGWAETPLGWRKVTLNWDDGNWQLDFRHRGEAVAPGTEQYDVIHENPFVVVGPETALSTFSIDVDTASYANVRRFLNENRLPPPNAVRIEELVNYFAYDYPQPQGRHPFSVNMEVAQCPWKDDNLLLRIGLKGQEVDRGDRPPGNVVFLLDVSGSMKADNKLPLLKRAMQMLVEQLTEDDQVTIVTYAGEAGLRLNTTSGNQHAEISSAIDSLSASGSTNGSAGIELAYRKAMESFIEEGTNRVILATDGDLNVGISDDEQLVQLIQEKAENGVFLTVLGFGTGNLQDAKLEKLADHGNGMYGYIDSLREARKVLVEQLEGSLVTIAKDVKLQLEFNPAEVRSYRLIGYENRVMAARDFHDDTKDAGEIGAGHTVTALYELEPANNRLTRTTPDARPGERSLKYQRAAEPETTPTELTDAASSGELLTLSLRYKPPKGNESTMIEVPLDARAPSFEAASSDFRFASMVAAFGMLLRGSEHCGDISLGAVEEWASTALGDDPQGRRTEFVDLVRQAKKLKQ